MGLAVVSTTLDGETVGLRAADGTITELGSKVEPRPGDDVIHAEGLALVPGLVNGHTHAAMTLFRGYADDLPLMEWLERYIWPAERRMDDDDVYWGTRLACLEMIKSGTTRFWDMYWRPDAAARAVEDAGLRAVVAPTLIDGSGGAKGAAEARARVERSFEAIATTAGGRVSAGLAPHAIYSVGEESLRWVAERAEEFELPVQIHLSETEPEVKGCLAEHGDRPAAYLDRLGLLGERTVLAHGVWLDDGELALIAERGATVVTNPVANLKLAVGGVFPYRAARERGVRVGLGTDGAGSNNSLDLMADVKVFALLQKHVADDPAAVTAGEAWEVATGQRSQLLGGSALAVGAPADFLLVRTDSPGLSLGALDAGLVYAVSGDVVDTTVVAGEVLMRGGVVEGEEEVVAMTRERARRLGLIGPRSESSTP
jgi:5-methylthioadenosine/S-adenosylhomocysteine deaminase